MPSNNRLQRTLVGNMGAPKFLACVLVVLGSPASWAGEPRSWQLTRSSVEEVRVPEAIAAHPVLVELEIPSGVGSTGIARRDLNDDGAEEYFVQSAPTLCGNGGCPYAIFDGRTLAYLEQVFGNVIREREERFKGWAVLECFAHLSASSTTYGVFAFAGSAYARVSSLELPASVATRLLKR